MKFSSFALSALLFTLAPGPALSAPNKMVSQVSKSRFEVSRAALEKEIKDPGKELSKFRAMPSFGQGLFSGIKVSHFSEDCILPRFGIKSGDVIEMVNGQFIRGPGDIMEIGKKLVNAKPGAKVRVGLRRGDQDLVQTYLVVN